MKQKVVVDKNIPFISEVLNDYFDVVALPSCEINREVVKDAVALLIRTRTLCNEALLEGSSVEFIGTATIGYDHIDLKWCESRGIAVKTAVGCNAGGVVNYVLRCLMHFGCEPSETTVGVVGVGNVGSLLNERLKYWGFNTLLCDPIRQVKEGASEFVGYDEVLANSDVVTFHTPLTLEGEYKTFELLDKESLEKCKQGVSVLNSSRGEVVCEKDLLDAIKENKVSHCALDVWCDEPNINKELLALVDIATPHIAGYSVQGKANGSAIVVNELFRHFNCEKNENWYPENILKREYLKTSWEEFKLRLISEYEIISESELLKTGEVDFEKFRNDYNFRNEIL
ncbi:MAG: 4-phosphoerythronate dehydrogenase [Rikenellaceae bacterium]